jgi:hypothetical protein
MLETGHVVNGHLHNFDHVTIILAGRFLVEKTKKDGSKTSIEIEGGFPSSRILIDKDAWHRLTVLRGPACYMCVYPHRSANGEVSEIYTGWEEAYDIPKEDQIDRNKHIARK